MSAERNYFQEDAPQDSEANFGGTFVDGTVQARKRINRVGSLLTVAGLATMACVGAGGVLGIGGSVEGLKGKSGPSVTATVEPTLIPLTRPESTPPIPLGKDFQERLLKAAKFTRQEKICPEPETLESDLEGLIEDPQIVNATCPVSGK